MTNEYIFNFSQVAYDEKNKNIIKKTISEYLSSKYKEESIDGYRIKFIEDNVQAEAEGVPEDIIEVSSSYPFYYVHVNYPNKKQREQIEPVILAFGLRLI